MNIALITGSFLPNVGGVEWKVHYLATEYTRRGHSVTVFTTKPEWQHRKTALPVSPTYGLVRLGYPVPGLGRLGINGWLIRRGVLALHHRRPIDVLHCHHLCTPTHWGVQIARKTGLPIVVTTCGGDIFAIPELNYGVRLNSRFDRIVRENVVSVDVIGSISRAVRAELEAIGTKARIEDIPNGVPWEEFQTGPSRLLRERVGLSDQDLIIISVGRNANFKRYDLGIAAFAKVADRFPQAYYIIIGRELESLRPLVEKYMLQGRVRLEAELHISQLSAMFRSADVFFNPSMREGFAQVNAQALACGLPCVITDAPGNVDAADYGGALVARDQDVDSMAEKLAALLGDPMARRKLGAEAHAGSRNYAWSRIAERYLAVFEQLRAQRPAVRQAS